LYDFDPALHTMPDEKLTGLDRWVLNEFAKLERDVLAAYDRYEFHVVYQRISQFAAVELSAIYHDVVKDRLYTDAANSPRRRSTQTAIHRLVTGLCRLLSPILAFTADEAWEFVPGVATKSVHEETYSPRDVAFSEVEDRLWQELFAIRNDAGLLELERARQEKVIGKSLEAKITFRGDVDALRVAKENEPTLRELLNVSQVAFETLTDLGEFTAKVTKADGQKCERCWHWELDVGAHSEHPGLCGRCVEAVQSGAAALA
jgi:isoleucyl-tRNA synthetase